VEAALGQAQLEREGDQALLGAVVQIALQAPALGHAGLDDARAAHGQLVHAGAQLRLQAAVLHREARRGGHGGQQLRVVAQAAVVDERADHGPVEQHVGRGAHGIVRGGQGDGVAAPVDDAVARRQAVGELELRVPRAPASRERRSPEPISSRRAPSRPATTPARETPERRIPSRNA
jgi:hypothetical protein